MASSGADRAHRLALGSVLVGLIVLGLKFLAYRLTGSIALYSDALESIINVVAALVAWWAIRFGARPADANHPFGHTKAEYLSAVFEGVLIVIAALSILREAWDTWLHPHPLQASIPGLSLNVAATVLNGLWSALLTRKGRLWRSAALVADGRHLLSDVLGSAGVLLGLVLALATGWLALDAILAAFVAFGIIWSGGRLIRDSVDGLMDAAPAPAVVEHIRAAIREHCAGALEAHDLRTRQAGPVTFVEFHLVVPGSMSVDASHVICDRLEQAIGAAVEGARVTIHVEPESKAKRRG